jgi:hypothetical protein
MKMLSKKERILFVDLFDDLSFEIEEQGYLGLETDLIGDILSNHFGISFECPNQLDMFTECILKHQNELQRAVKGACIYGGII